MNHPTFWKKKYEEHKEKKRRIADEDFEEAGDKDLIGGMAKAKDLRVMMMELRSLEERLVEANVIKPRASHMRAGSKMRGLVAEVKMFAARSDELPFL